MKLVLAYLPPEQLQDVIDALSADHVANLVVSPARNLGQEHGQAARGEHDHLGIAMTRRVRLEICCRDDEVDGVLEAIYQAAHTTNVRRAGMVLVLPVERARALRTESPAASGEPASG